MKNWLSDDDDYGSQHGSPGCPEVIEKKPTQLFDFKGRPILVRRPVGF